MAYRERKSTLPNHVTELEHDAYQVRVYRDGKEFSAVFRWDQHASREEAINEAVKWRDRVLSKNSVSRYEAGYCIKTNSNKKSGLPVGVTLYISRRRDVEYFNYAVCYRSKKGPNVKTFSCGRLDDLTEASKRHALNTAIAFRERYEYCKLHGFKFDDTIRGWKEEVRYPFFPHRCNLEPIEAN